MDSFSNDDVMMHSAARNIAIVASCTLVNVASLRVPIGSLQGPPQLNLLLFIVFTPTHIDRAITLLINGLSNIG